MIRISVKSTLAIGLLVVVETLLNPMSLSVHFPILKLSDISAVRVAEQIFQSMGKKKD